MYLITNTKHCAQPQTGWGAEEPFGESPPPLETINKGPKRCTFLHTRPKTHLGEPRVRETSRAELRKHLSPSLSRNLLETWKLREIFFSPSRPPAHLQQTLELEPASQTRSAPPAAATGDSRRRAGPGESPEPRPRRRRRWPGRRGSLPVSRPSSPSQATSGRPALSPDSRLSTPPPPLHPRRGTKGGFSRVTARPPRGRRRGPQCGRPPHKGAAHPGRSVGALVPAPRTGSHPPAGVCASVHRNAGSEGGLQEPGRAGWTGRDGGEGRSERGRGAGERRQVEQRGPPARHGQRGGRAGDASLTRPTGARRSVRPGLRAPGSERCGQAGGGARAGRGRRAGRGLGPRAPAGTGNAPWSARPTGSV